MWWSIITNKCTGKFLELIHLWENSIILILGRKHNSQNNIDVKETAKQC